jgi:hypothetical protein
MARKLLLRRGAHFPDSFLFAPPHLCGESRLPRARKVRNQI